MKKALKLLLLAVTLLPWADLIKFLWSFFILLLSGSLRELDLSQPFWLTVAKIVWLVSMTAFYEYHVFKNRQIGKNMRVFWAVLLPLTNMYSMPVYWYLYIWREKP